MQVPNAMPNWLTQPPETATSLSNCIQKRKFPTHALSVRWNQNGSAIHWVWKRRSFKIGFCYDANDQGFFRLVNDEHHWSANSDFWCSKQCWQCSRCQFEQILLCPVTISCVAMLLPAGCHSNVRIQPLSHCSRYKPLLSGLCLKSSSLCPSNLIASSVQCCNQRKPILVASQHSSSATPFSHPPMYSLVMSAS